MKSGGLKGVFHDSNMRYTRGWAASSSAYSSSDDDDVGRGLSDGDGDTVDAE